jgi:hypothetical protein
MVAISGGPATARAVRRSFLFRDAAWLLAEEAELRAAYAARDLDALSRLITGELGLPERDPATGEAPLRVTHLPLADWDIALPADPAAEQAVRDGRRPSPDAALAIRFARPEFEAAFRAAVEPLFGCCDPHTGDVAIGSALHWVPGRGEGTGFGALADAHRLIRAGALAAQGLDGAGVNVVIVDQGIAAARLPAGTRFMGGWTRPGGLVPGAADADNRHGTMVARNVLTLAPRAAIWDCPLIPARILGNVQAFMSDAHGAVERMKEDIALLRAHDPATYGGRWVFVNAWSIYDRRGEAEPGDCTCSAEHQALRAVREAAQHADIVFCAGNCGQFGPDGRCADDVIGPGASILGANSLPEVLTVGAVRADGVWAGYSSQGPGQFDCGCAGAREKPDLAAPSSFAMGGVAGGHAGGTSAASAVAAGVVAALRTRGTAGEALAPAALFDLLRRSARQAGAPGWNGRTGHGVIDTAAALALLRAETVP